MSAAAGEVTTGFEVQMVQVHTVEVHMVEERLQICFSKPLELLVQHQRLLPAERMGVRIKACIVLEAAAQN